MFQFWTKMSTPTKIVLSGQVLALMYSAYKKSHVSSVVTGMTIVGTVLAEMQAQKVLAAQGSRTSDQVTEISSVGDFAKLRSV